MDSQILQKPWEKETLQQTSENYWDDSKNLPRGLSSTNPSQTFAGFRAALQVTTLR